MKFHFLLFKLKHYIQLFLLCLDQQQFKVYNTVSSPKKWAFIENDQSLLNIFVRNIFFLHSQKKVILHGCALHLLSYIQTPNDIIAKIWVNQVGCWCNQFIYYCLSLKSKQFQIQKYLAAYAVRGFVQKDSRFKWIHMKIEHTKGLTPHWALDFFRCNSALFRIDTLFRWH